MSALLGRVFGLAFTLTGIALYLTGVVQASIIYRGAGAFAVTLAIMAADAGKRRSGGGLSRLATLNVWLLIGMALYSLYTYMFL